MVIKQSICIGIFFILSGITIKASFQRRKIHARARNRSIEISIDGGEVMKGLLFSGLCYSAGLGILGGKASMNTNELDYDASR